MHRAIHAAGEEVLKPGAVEPAHALMAAILSRQEHHRAVLGEQLHHVLGTIEIDVIPIGPVQSPNGIDVLEFADAVLQG